MVTWCKTSIRTISWIGISFFILFAHSCKKEDQTPELSVLGRIIDETTQIGVQGATVKLSQQLVENGTLTSIYQEVATVNASADGSYQFKFPREIASAYRLEVSRLGYFSIEQNINPENVSVGSPYSSNILITPMAWVRTEVQNLTPFSGDDVSTFQFLNASFQCVCCDNSLKTFQGMNVNSSEKCLLEGNFQLKYRYTINQDTINIAVIDSVFCTALDTTIISITY